MKKNVIIILLVIIILCLGGYLVFDKVLTNESENNNESVQESNVDDQNTLSKEEAYNIGNELYEYVQAVLLCEKFEYGESDENLGTEIKNFEEISNMFAKNNKVLGYSKIGYSGYTEDQLYDFTQKITYKNGKYYSIDCPLNRGNSLTYLKTDLQLSNKTPNELSFKAISTYCKEPGDDYLLTGKCNAYEEKEDEFKLKYEDNDWKIFRFILPN